METQKYYFRVGIFFVVVASAFVYYLIVFGGEQEGRNLVRYAIYFEQSVSGLQPGAPVKLKGIDVGQVDDLRFVSRDNDTILVLVDVDEKAPVNQSTIASVATQGITGASYLSLENSSKPGEKPALIVKQTDEKYLVIKSGTSDMQSALANAPALINKLGRTTDQVGGLVPEAHDALVEASGAFREIKMLARTLREDPSIILRGSKYEGYKVQQ